MWAINLLWGDCVDDLCVKLKTELIRLHHTIATQLLGFVEGVVGALESAFKTVFGLDVGHANTHSDVDGLARVLLVDVCLYGFSHFFR